MNEEATKEVTSAVEPVISPENITEEQIRAMAAEADGIPYKASPKANTEPEVAAQDSQDASKTTPEAEEEVKDSDESAPKAEEKAEVVADGKPKQTENILVDELPLQTRTVNALKKHGVETLAQLAKLTDEEIADIKNLGEKSITEIQKLLEKEGYR